MVLCRVFFTITSNGSNLIFPNLSHSFVESEEILKLMTHDNMTSTSDLPSSEGAKFDINTVMKKIEKAGSSNSWAKVISCWLLHE